VAMDTFVVIAASYDTLGAAEADYLPSATST
jgi:hypothetical protein